MCVYDVYTYVWHTWEWTIQWSIHRFPQKIVRSSTCLFGHCNVSRGRAHTAPSRPFGRSSERAIWQPWGNPGDVYSKQDFHRSFQWSILSSALGHTESWEWKKEDEGSITGITPDLLWLLRGPPLDMLYSSKNGWPDLARVWCWCFWNYSCWFYLYHSHPHLCNIFICVVKVLKVFESRKCR